MTPGSVASTYHSPRSSQEGQEAMDMTMKPRLPCWGDGGSQTESSRGSRAEEDPRRYQAVVCDDPRNERKGMRTTSEPNGNHTPIETREENPDPTLKSPSKGMRVTKQASNNQTETDHTLSGKALYDWINTTTSGFTKYPYTLVQRPKALLLALRMCWAVTIPELYEIFHRRRRPSLVYVPKRRREAGALLNAVEYHFKEFHLHSRPEIIEKIFKTTWKIYQGEYKPIPPKKLCFTVNEQRLRRLYDELQYYTNGLRGFPDWVLIISPLYLYLIQVILGVSRKEYAEILEVHDEDEVSRILHGRRWYTDRKMLRRTIRRQLAKKLHRHLKSKTVTWEKTLQNFRKLRNYSCGDMGNPEHLRKIAPMHISELETVTLEHLEPLKKEFPDITIVQQDRLKINGWTKIPDLTIRRQGRLEAIIECQKIRTRLNVESSAGKVDLRAAQFKEAHPATAVIAIIDSFTENTRVLDYVKSILRHVDRVFTREELKHIIPYVRELLTNPDFRVNFVVLKRIPRSQLLSQSPSSLFLFLKIEFQSIVLIGTFLFFTCFRPRSFSQTLSSITLNEGSDRPFLMNNAILSRSFFKKASSKISHRYSRKGGSFSFS